MIRNRLLLKENQEEDLVRISPLLPLSIYLTDFSDHAYSSVRWHWHEDFQLCLVLSGKVSLHTAGNSYLIEKGNGFFINSRFAHSVDPAMPDSAYYCINFPPFLIVPERDQALYQTVSCHSFPESCRLYASSIRITRRESGCSRRSDRSSRISENEKITGWELLIHGAVLSAWPDLFMLADRTLSHDAVSSNVFNERLTRIMEFLQTHYPKKLTLSEIAASIGLCPEECERFFKRMTGMTIFQYLLEYRIGKKPGIPGRSQPHHR